jgi:hypothetical protein
MPWRHAGNPVVAMHVGGGTKWPSIGAASRVAALLRHALATRTSAIARACMSEIVSADTVHQ